MFSSLTYLLFQWIDLMLLPLIWLVQQVQKLPCRTEVREEEGRGGEWEEEEEEEEEMREGNLNDSITEE